MKALAAAKGPYRQETTETDEDKTAQTLLLRLFLYLDKPLTPVLKLVPLVIPPVVLCQQPLMVG